MSYIKSCANLTISDYKFHKQYQNTLQIKKHINNLFITFLLNWLFLVT